MEFWALIAKNVSRPLSVEAACVSLADALRSLSSDEAVEFCRKFDENVGQAYTWDLWGVAYLANGGCGDDTFMDFRSSLVLLGQAIFEDAIRDPESLLELDAGELSELFEEGALYLGSTACEEKGVDAPARRGPTEPLGEPWEETREALMARFPKAWSVYGWEEPSETVAASPAVRKPWWKFW